MSRRIVKRIHINNGHLTYEVPEDDSSSGAWYRNGKLLKGDDLKNYKFYDTKAKAYRVLGTPILQGNVKDGVKVVGARVNPYVGTYESLLDSAKLEYDKRYNTEVKQTFKSNGKLIHLKTKGKMNLATVPVNLLDTIAINSGRSNTDVATNLGLVAKESSLGGQSYYLTKAAYKNKGYTDKEADSISTKIINTALYDPWTLTNNHAYFTTKFNDTLGEIYRKAKTSDDKERMAVNAIKYNTLKDNTPHYDANIMADAFTRYAAAPDKYNPGQSSYIPMVRNLTNEVFYEPQIQNWWNTEGKTYYNKGLSERHRLESAGKKSK